MESANLSPVTGETATNADPAYDDSAANETVRRVATRGVLPKRNTFPTQLAKRLYQHVDWMRVELFDGKLPEVVLSFEATNSKTLGHYVLGRNAMGLQWNVNVNRRHLKRPEQAVVATLLHELVHVWQDTYGHCGRPPYHNAEFQERVRALGIPTDLRGHYEPPREASPFHNYCLRHEVAWTPPPPELPAPVELATRRHFDPAPRVDEKPFDDGSYGEVPVRSGSPLKKWTCSCGVNVRVAVADFDATCNKCKTLFVLQD